MTEGESEQDFERALALEADRKRGLHRPAGNVIPEFLYYRERIKYAEHLERAYTHFPREQVLVLLYEEFLADNAATYRRVVEFLGVDPSFQPDFAQHNTGGKVLQSREKAGLLQRLTHGRGAFAFVKPFAKALVPRKARKKLVRGAYDTFVLRDAEPVDPVLARRLRQEFKPEVQKISDLLGRDLIRFWKYDQV